MDRQVTSLHLKRVAAYCGIMVALLAVAFFLSNQQKLLSVDSSALSASIGYAYSSCVSYNGVNCTTQDTNWGGYNACLANSGNCINSLEFMYSAPTTINQGQSAVLYWECESPSQWCPSQNGGANDAGLWDSDGNYYGLIAAGVGAAYFGSQAIVIGQSTVTPSHTVTYYVRLPNTSSGTIKWQSTVNVNVSAPTVTIIKTADAAEGSANAGAGTSGTFLVSFDHTYPSSITVNFTTSGTAAGSGTDFQNFGTSVVVPANTSSATITVAPRTNNATVQGAKTLTVTLSPSASYTVGAPSNATMNITDDDVLPVLSITKTADAAEGSANAGAGTSGTFNFALDHAVSSATVVNFTTSGTASAGGVDFQNFGTSVTIPANTLSANLNVAPRTNDASYEGLKTLTITAASSASYSGVPSATMNITDDEAAPAVLVNVAAGASAVRSPVQNGTFTFTRTGTGPLGFTTLASPVTNTGPRYLATGDFNGDGKQDMAVADYTFGYMSVFMGNGDGTFGAKTDYSLGGAPMGIAVGDVNGDGKPDIVVAAGSSAMVVLTNNGSGIFSAATYAAGVYPQGVALADFNGDGKLDIATAESNSNTMSVFLNNGNGTFAAKVDYTASTFPYWIAAADLNGDGKPDIVTANYTPGTVSVFLNNGNGTFGAKTDYTVGTNPVFVALGDFNGDGKADIAAAATNGGAISVLLNNGSGSFGAKTDYATTGNPSAVALADLDGDGKLDMISVNKSGNAAGVFLGTGTGTFGARTDYAVGSNPWGVAVADITGDSRLDIVAVNNSANTVSVLVNTPASLPSVTVNFHQLIQTVNGLAAAVAATDYTAPSPMTVTIPAGVSPQSAIVTIPPLAGSGGSYTTIAQIPVSATSPGVGGLTLRQLINASQFSQNGLTKTRVTFNGGSLGATISAAYIGLRSGGATPYAFASTPVQLTFNSGSPSVTVPANGTVVSDGVNFMVPGGTDVVVSYYTAAGSANYKLSAANSSWDAYFVSGNDAATVNAAGYTFYSALSFGIPLVEGLVSGGATDKNLTLSADAGTGYTVGSPSTATIYITGAALPICAMTSVPSPIYTGTPAAFGYTSSNGTDAYYVVDGIESTHFAPVSSGTFSSTFTLGTHNVYLVVTNSTGYDECWSGSSSGGAGTTPADNPALGTAITAVPPPPTVTITKTADANESSANANAGKSGTFIVAFDHSVSTPTVVNFTTSGTASAGGVDFQNFGTSVTIPANTTSATITVPPRTNDNTYQGSKTLTVNISSSASYTGTPSASMTITDDEVAVPTLFAPLSASASRVRKGTTATLNWSMINLTSGTTCNLSSTPAGVVFVNFTVTTNPVWAGPLTTGAINQNTTFRLSCTTPASIQVSSPPINIMLVPSFNEV